MLTRRSLLAAPLLAADTPRPNLVFVLVDDLRFDELGCTGHPFASTPHADRLAREGVRFTNAFATTPLCSPSRASFLTGLYPHACGITDNTSRAPQSHRLVTWPRLLRDAGYDTAFIGKWHMGNDDSPRPGFDTWVSFRGQGECLDPDLNVDGRPEKSRGYVTDILTDHAVRFLERRREKPFCLYLAHKAIHPNITQREDGSVVGSLTGAESFIPAERHRTLYAGARIPRRPTYGKPPRGKPALERPIDSLPPLGPATVTADEVILNRMRMMKAVDEGLGRIMETLEKAGRLDDTLVALTSDHGYFYGEHGLDAERRLAYEETIRIPLLMRYPRRFRAGTRIDRFALSLDVAPTMLALGQATAPPGLHGRSLVSLLEGRKPVWRDAFLIEYFTDTVFPRIRNMGYQAVRTGQWKYIRYGELPGMDELYDLRRDPFETENLAAAASARGPLEAARARLEKLLRDHV
ncbi:MAG: sulfatase family protein [Bryobacteraceae bacterium]